MYDISFSKEFIRDAKRLKRKRYDMTKVYAVFHILTRGEADTLRRRP